MPSTIAALVIGVVAAGVSAYGMYQQGQSQKAIANYNSQEQQRQAKEQMRMMQTQAEMQRQQADSNFKLRQMEVEARMNNARAMEGRALQQDGVNQLNLRKRREEFERMHSDQRAMIAHSGVSESSGTPLDMLAEMRAKITLDQNEQGYINEVNRRTLLNESVMERLGGRMALVGATLDRDSQVAEAGLRDAAAHGQFLAGMRAADITRLTGEAAAQGANYQAAGTLLSGFASAGSMYTQRFPSKANNVPKSQGTTAHA